MVSCARFLPRMVCGIFLLLATVAEAATITATIDRNPVQMNESFHLILEADGEPRSPPDLGVLEQDFEIISRNQSNNIQILNGEYQQKIQWTLTLLARRAGDLKIPAITFGKDRSTELDIEVVEAEQSAPGGQASGDIVIEVEVSSSTPYVHSQVLYVARLFRAVHTRNPRLTEPAVSDSAAVIEKLGDGASYETRRAGRRYLVVEQRYAVFPQRSGPLTIEPLRFEGYVIDGRGGQFFKRVLSESVELDVRPIPAQLRGQPWLPAQSLTLTEDWPQAGGQVKAGEAITRTIAIHAQGLASSSLPPLMAEPPAGLKQYPDQPTLNDTVTRNGVLGSRQEKVALIPTAGGEYLLPAIEIPWWNTVTDKLEIARLPERKINVEAAAVAVASNDSAASGDVSSNAVPNARSQSTDSKVWIWLSVFFAAGWIGTALIWWRSLQVSQPPARAGHETVNLNAIEQTLERGCTSNDAHMARTALIQWTRARWPDEHGTGLTALERHGGEALQQEIRRLDRALYGRSDDGWNGTALWQAFQRNKPAPAATTKPQQEILAPLYQE